MEDLEGDSYKVGTLKYKYEVTGFQRQEEKQEEEALRKSMRKSHHNQCHNHNHPDRLEEVVGAPSQGSF